ncbi:hypothetical protein [Neoaquamicrobium sediminum]|uniref:hypothetical protein n=1 Tax=Neoaquamicrobium sediminum TaxID=1849104 RepID=UPI0015673FAE|nr:hypothetical protein [Mesorhizobium sediminum]NRC57298.1 hypothetical protein [Mesorhizobium sediminum]
MTKPARAPRQPARTVERRKATTLEMIRHCCPDAALAAHIAEIFARQSVDSDGVRELHRRMIVETADAMSEGVGERAMQIHLQRIVGAYVGSAFGAGQFYSRAVSEARAASSRLENDARDEDRDGPVGFDSAADRKREFAADMCLQSHALLMAAEGAVSGYEHVVGERWKPYERAVENPGRTLDRKVAEMQMAAFG